MRVEPGKRHPDESKDGERETCKRVELDWTEVRGVAALDISVFGSGGLKLRSLAT
jgi:hypothetical protein